MTFSLLSLLLLVPSGLTVGEFETLHAQLQLPPPTETYTIEELEDVVARLRAQLEEPAL